MVVTAVWLIRPWQVSRSRKIASVSQIAEVTADVTKQAATRPAQVRPAYQRRSIWSISRPSQTRQAALASVATE